VDVKRLLSEITGTDESSNFRALLNFRAEEDTSLQQHLVTAPRNATHIGHRTQSELIGLCGAEILDQIVKGVNQAKYFTLLADKTADVGNTKQVSICVRYCDSEYEVREDFLGFVGTRDTTGETLVESLLNKLGEHVLDECTMVGQVYDGAASMSGQNEGVQARLKEHHP